MVEIFFLLFCNCCITYAYCVPQILTIYLFNLLCIFIHKRTAKLFECFSITFRNIRKPFFYFFDKKISNLSVRNYKTIFSAFSAAVVRQITCRKKHAPQIFYALIYLVVGQLRSYILFNTLPCYQPLYFRFCRNISHVDKSADNRISA